MRGFLRSSLTGLPLPASDSKPLKAFPLVLATGAAYTLVALITAGLLFRQSMWIAESGLNGALLGIATGKAAGIAGFLREREADVLEIRSSLMSLKEIVGELELARRRLAARHMLLAMREIRRGFDCSGILLLDRDGRLLLSEPDSEGDSLAQLLSSARETLSTRKVVFRDVYLTRGQELRVAWLAPVHPGVSSTPNDPVVTLLVNPEPFLAQLLTAEDVAGAQVIPVLELTNGKKLALRSRGLGSSARLEMLEAGHGTGLPSPSTRSSIQLASNKYASVTVPIPGTPWSLETRADKLAFLSGPWAVSRLVGLILAGFVVAAAWLIALTQRHRSFKVRLKMVEAELARRRLKQRFESVLRQAGDAIYWATTDGRILDMNEKALEMYGYSRSELMRMRLPELRPPEFREEAEAMLRTVLEKGECTFEAIHQNKSGARFPVEITACVVTSLDEQWILGIVRDTSERHKAQLALKESQLRLRAALEHAGAMLTRQDLSLRYTWWSGARKLDPPGGILGRKDEDIFGPSEGSHLARIKEGVLRTGRGARVQARCPTWSGTAVFDLVIQPETDDQGRPTGLVTLLLDITEKAVAHQLLSISEQRYRLLVEQIPGAVYTRSLEPGYPWIYVSPQIQELLGFSPGEWLSFPGLTESLVHPEDRPKLTEALAASVLKGESISITYRIQKKDGTWKRIRDRFFLVQYEGHTPSHLQGILVEELGTPPESVP